MGVKASAPVVLLVLATALVASGKAINAPRQVTCAGVCCEAGVVAVAGTLCSNSTGPCDEPAYCDGQYEDCPANPLASSTTVCRNSSGPCEEPGMCSGTTADCPASPIRPSGFVCRNSTGCEAEAVCDGTNIQCPESGPAPANTVCFIPEGNPCRLTGQCDGQNTTCPEIREADGTECFWSPFDDNASLFNLGRQPASFPTRRLSSRPSARYIPPARRYGSRCHGRRCESDNEDSEYDNSAGEYPRRDYAGDHPKRDYNHDNSAGDYSRRDYHDGEHDNSAGEYPKRDYHGREHDNSAGDYSRRDYHDSEEYKDYKEELPHHGKYPTCGGTCSAGHCFKALEGSGCCVIYGREYSDDGLYCWGH